MNNSLVKSKSVPSTILRELMDDYGITVSLLSDATGLSTCLIRNILNGKAEMSIRSAMRISYALNCDFITLQIDHIHKRDEKLLSAVCTKLI